MTGAVSEAIGVADAATERRAFLARAAGYEALIDVLAVSDGPPDEIVDLALIAVGEDGQAMSGEDGAEIGA
jgi:hypothetical protein